MGGAPWSDADPSPVDAAGRAQLERGAALVRDELLFVEPPSDLPRYLSGVGSGEVAMAVLDVGLLWALADGLAAGQAPDLDLGVAPVPGPDGASVPTGSYVYVISATASDAERAGATELLHWLLEPAQQGQLHQFTDLFPVDPAAADDPSLVEYWGNLPLLGAAYNVLVEHATPGMHEPLLPWPDRMRAGGTIHDALVVADAALAVQRLDELRGGVEDYFADPARWLACISAAGTVACGPGDPAPIPFDD